MTEQRNDDILSTENPSEIVGIKKVSKVKLSTKGRYGLRALIDLAANDTGEAVSIQSIAGRQNISESYLEQLMRSDAKRRSGGQRPGEREAVIVLPDRHRKSQWVIS